MRRFPAALLSVLSIIALAGMGISYTLWADRLDISGTVHTGIVDVAFSNVQAVEAAEVEGKNVGSCTAVTSTGVIGNLPAGAGNQGLPPGGNVDAGPDEVDITLDNAYPFYACDITVTVKNVGTIPVKLKQLVFANPNPVALTMSQSNCWADEFQLEAFQSQTPPPPAVFVNEASCTLHIMVKEEASESTTYNFSSSFLAHQWNEAAP